MKLNRIHLISNRDENHALNHVFKFNHTSPPTTSDDISLTRTYDHTWLTRPLKTLHALPLGESMPRWLLKTPARRLGLASLHSFYLLYYKLLIYYFVIWDLCVILNAILLYVLFLKNYKMDLYRLFQENKFISVQYCYILVRKENFYYTLSRKLLTYGSNCSYFCHMV